MRESTPAPGENRCRTRWRIRTYPHLEFHEGAHPGDSSYWVNAKDELSLSLLQARLIDLKVPIKIVEGK